jgi:hypothetical protein
MRILFSADLHIKLGAKNVPIEWALNRYDLLEEQLDDLQHHADIIVLGGDIFDKLPNMAELDVYFRLISIFRKPTFIIPGNHEALKKDTTFLTQLKFVSSSINPDVVIIDDYFTYEGIDFIPYNRLKDFEKNGHEFSSNVLVTHVRGEIPPHVKPEVDLSIFDQWKVVLAGDLHSYDCCQRNILYPGSPVTTSFHRHVVDTGVILLDTDTCEHEWVKLELPQLLKHTLKVGEPMVATDYHHTIYEVEGNLSELSNMEDNELLDKKIMRRSSDTALILTPEMSIETEVDEYLRFILQLNDGTIEKVLKEFSNYAHKIKS